MSALTESPAWQALAAHHAPSKDVHMRTLFAEDPKRFERFSLAADDVLVDYSKHRVTDETMKLLFALARQANVEEWRDEMFAGEKINGTEDRAVLHVALRNRSNRPILVDGKDVMPEVNAVLAKMRAFTDAVRSGAWKGYTGKRITDVVNIGIGGTRPRPGHGDRGAAAVLAGRAARALRLQRRRHAHRRDAASALDPETTLFIVASQDVHDAGDADQRALGARAGSSSSSRTRSRGAPSTSSPCRPTTEEVTKFGIDTAQHVRLLGLGRRPLLALVRDRPVDRAASSAWTTSRSCSPAATRWTSTSAPRRSRRTCRSSSGCSASGTTNFFGAADARHPAVRPVHAPLPRVLPAGRHGEQRQARRPRRPRHRPTTRPGPIVWGEPGTNGQHAFYQLIHQGTRVDPVRLPRAGRDAQPDRRAPRRSCSRTSSRRPRR